MANKNKNGKVLFKGLSYKPGNKIATVVNYDTSYGDDNKKLFIIKQLKQKGIKKIRKGRKLLNLYHFFKVEHLRNTA